MSQLILIARRAIRGLVSLAVLTTAFFNISLAENFKCNICGMDIQESAKNHIVLATESQEKKLHVCALSCVKKAKKHDHSLKNVKVANFNKPSELLDADQAYFLIGSKKIKSDLGDVMGPYFGAFKSKEEANQAKEKYGDGQVVKGIQEAMP